MIDLEGKDKTIIKLKDGEIIFSRSFNPVRYSESFGILIKKDGARPYSKIFSRYAGNIETTITEALLEFQRIINKLLDNDNFKS